MWVMNVTACKEISLPEITLYPITKLYYLDDAVEYCRRHRGRVLASLHDSDVLKKVADYLQEFSCGYPMFGWNVGLRLSGEQGSWVDGTKFDMNLHRELFNEHSFLISSDCDVPVLYRHRDGKLRNSYDCDGNMYFFCTDRKIGEETTTTVATTTKTHLYNEYDYVYPYPYPTDYDSPIDYHDAGSGGSEPLNWKYFFDLYFPTVFVCLLVIGFVFSIFKRRDYSLVRDDEEADDANEQEHVRSGGNASSLRQPSSASLEA